MAIEFLQGSVVTSPVSDFSVTDDLTVADKIDAGGDATIEGITRANDDFIAMGAALNKLIETDSSADKLAIFGATPVVQPTALTAGLTHITHTAPGAPDYALQDLVKPGTGLTTDLTHITHTAPGAPDYALQDLTDTGGFGFKTKDEGNTALAVILNLQVRVAELEAAAVYGFKTKDEGNTLLKVVLNQQVRIDELETKLTALGALAV